MQQFSFAAASLMDQLGSALSPDALAGGRLDEDGIPAERAHVPVPVRPELRLPPVRRRRLAGGRAAYDDLPQATAEILFGGGRRGAEDPGDVVAQWWMDASSAARSAPRWLGSRHQGASKEAAVDGAEDGSPVGRGELTLFTDGDRSALAIALVAKDDGATAMP